MTGGKRAAQAHDGQSCGAVDGMGSGEYNYAEHVAAFLDFLRRVDSEAAIAEGTLRESDDETQDLLHALELEERGYHGRAKVAALLADVRRKRRAAKDVGEILQPLCQWAQNNRAAIKQLEQVLGAMRKKEKSLAMRTYSQRTGILRSLEKGGEGDGD